MTQEAHDNDMGGATAFYCPDSHNERKRRAQDGTRILIVLQKLKIHPLFYKKPANPHCRNRYKPRT